MSVWVRIVSGANMYIASRKWGKEKCQSLK
jgi:hypothetical protein